ncbi:iron-containing alcohol dehydrogenase [Roseofilum casamattae]|uniref:Iron-containing alcohol dehydrogenase n=1 Tax=Roseofilum casamattae BLCC-M143 TaxID=3022442 RepID=A0ABT7BVV3_9CYAN|nr:iron-containing alcohol dehydrogenase [Roseofilum casamattae]MDJ1182644.1 iron-containing alcohol dehydrogenase [Roseofilum casamattae BLCC-M143]
MKAFRFTKVPPIHFGAGQLQCLPDTIAQLQGDRVLLVTGEQSLAESGTLTQVQSSLTDAGVAVHHMVCDRPPSDVLLDRAIAELEPLSINIIVAIGGGSAIDMAKALSAFAMQDCPAREFLKNLEANTLLVSAKLPTIAIPTTAGVGSEVTSKVAIERADITGVRRFFSHPLFTPDAIILDPQLTLSCPAQLTASSGLVTLVHLLEAKLSPEISPLADAIVWNGLEALKDNLLLVCSTRSKSLTAHSKMSYASCLSGLGQANLPLGMLQGLALTLSSFCPIPYRVACSTLAGVAMRIQLKALRARTPHSPVLQQIAKVGALFDGRMQQNSNYYCDASIDLLEAWVQILNIPRLRNYGIKLEHLAPVVEKTLDTVPNIGLSRDELHTILQERL